MPCVGRGPRREFRLWAVVWALGFLPAVALAFHPDVYTPRVPADYLEKARDTESPFSVSAEKIGEGKEIYFGKGLCVTCHGKDGKGVQLPGHAPRDFTDKKWQDLRTDGELMWILKNGSPGTGMPVRVGKVISEDEGWSVIFFIRTFTILTPSP